MFKDKYKNYVKAELSKLTYLPSDLEDFIKFGMDFDEFNASLTDEEHELFLSLIDSGIISEINDEIYNELN